MMIDEGTNNSVQKNIKYFYLSAIYGKYLDEFI